MGVLKYHVPVRSSLSPTGRVVDLFFSLSPVLFAFFFKLLLISILLLFQSLGYFRPFFSIYYTILPLLHMQPGY